MNPSVDVAASLALAFALTLALVAHLASSVAAGRLLADARVDREAALPLVGRAPMHAVYRALAPLARGLVSLGVSASAVSVASLFIAALAAVAFATGHFGVAAAVASVAAIADGVDGLVARISGTSSRLGQVLDTTIDRYVDALLLGGLAVFVRHDAVLLVLTLAAIVGSFMVSYASSVERELSVASGPVPMRRAHRLAYLIVAAAVAPLVGSAFGQGGPRAELAPVFVAVGAIAVVGNLSAVRRLVHAAHLAAGREARQPLPDPDPSAGLRHDEARR